MKIDFVDCYLAAKANEQKLVAFSFDNKDFTPLDALGKYRKDFKG